MTAVRAQRTLDTLRDLTELAEFIRHHGDRLGVIVSVMSGGHVQIEHTEFRSNNADVASSLINWAYLLDNVRVTVMEHTTSWKNKRCAHTTVHGKLRGAGTRRRLARAGLVQPRRVHPPHRRVRRGGTEPGRPAVTGPDPLECLNSRAAGGPILCGAPPSDHCAACLACTWGRNATCACLPLPAIGTQVMPKPTVRWNGKPIRQEPHVVVATWDHRRTGEPDDHVIVIQDAALVNYAVRYGDPVNTEHGAYLGLDDITVLDDQPRITFTAKETS